MDLKTFCGLYSNGIVLLEGKRNVREEDKIKLMEIGKLLAEKMPNATFRSGNADGSDYFFSQGVASVNPKQLQVVTPYTNHRKKYNLAETVYPLDTIDLIKEPDIVYHSKNHKGTKSLVEKYVNGDKNAYTIKGAYIIRDTIKVLGTNSGILPISVGMFYEDLQNPMQGGTGHTQRVCIESNIPLLNQEVYFSWLE